MSPQLSFIENIFHLCKAAVRLCGSFITIKKTSSLLAPLFLWICFLCKAEKFSANSRFHLLGNVVSLKKGIELQYWSQSADRPTPSFHDKTAQLEYD